MRKKIQSLILILLPFVLTQCAPKSASELPKDILGISVGMSKENAQKRLEEIAVFERDEEKRQQVWLLKDDAHFKYLILGYDASNQVRYVTAIAEPSVAKARIRFSEVGDLSKAKKEVLEPHYKYIWQVHETDGKPDYDVYTYGDSPEFLMHYSLSKRAKSEDATKAESEDEDDR